MDGLVFDMIISNLSFTGLYKFSQTCSFIYNFIHNSKYYIGYEKNLTKYKYGYYSAITIDERPVVGCINSDMDEEIGCWLSYRFHLRLYLMYFERVNIKKMYRMWSLSGEGHKIVRHKDGYKIFYPFEDGKLLLLCPFTDIFNNKALCNVPTLRDFLLYNYPRRSYLVNKILRTVDVVGKVFGIDIYTGTYHEVLPNEESFTHRLKTYPMIIKYLETKKKDFYEIMSNSYIREIVFSFLNKRDLLAIMITNTKLYRIGRTIMY